MRRIRGEVAIREPESMRSKVVALPTDVFDERLDRALAEAGAPDHVSKQKVHGNGHPREAATRPQDCRP